jgi:hypothetical protein
MANGAGSCADATWLASPNIGSASSSAHPDAVDRDRRREYVHVVTRTPMLVE